MRRFTILRGLLFALGVCASPIAHAQQSEGPPAAVLKHALSAAKNSEGVFKEEAESAVHVQSGLKCPAYLSNAFLLTIWVFESPAGSGLDVGCDYARRKAPRVNSAAAKHTVYAVKLADGMTLDDAFAKYSEEMHGSAPAGARSGGESLHMEDPVEGFPAFRSEEMFYTSSGKDWQTEVLVTVVNGWIIEVRSTRASQYSVSSQDETNDQFVALRLFFGAISALGGPKYDPQYGTEPSQPSEPAAKP